MKINSTTTLSSIALSQLKPVEQPNLALQARETGQAPRMAEGLEKYKEFISFDEYYEGYQKMMDTRIDGIFRVDGAIVAVTGADGSVATPAELGLHFGEGDHDFNAVKRILEKRYGDAMEATRFSGVNGPTQGDLRTGKLFTEADFNKDWWPTEPELSREELHKVWEQNSLIFKAINP